MQIAPLIAILLLACPALCATWFIEAGESIQTIVDIAQAGDTLILEEGVHEETVVFGTVPLVVGSRLLLDGDTSHVSRTIVCAHETRPDTGSCFVFPYDLESAGELAGITLRQGTGTLGSDGECLGGGVYVYRTRVHMRRCTIEDCSAFEGGGLYADGGAHNQAEVRLTDCIVRRCSAQPSGGGVCVVRCSLYVDSCVFDSDSVASFGGAVHAGSGHAEITNCTFRNCFGGFVGGLQHVHCSGRIERCLFDDNRASDSEPLALTHLFYGYGSAAVTGCVFRHNGTPCPSIYLASDHVPLQFIGNVVSEQTNALYGVGTVMVGEDSPGRIAYNVFAGNSNVHGGTIYSFGQATVRLDHNVFTGNTSHDPLSGSVLTCISQASPSLDSNLIAGNSGVAVSILSPAQIANIHAEHNWWGDASGPYHPTRNPNGRGDTLVCDSVIFEPWLTAPPDTTPPQSVSPRESAEHLSTWRLAAVYPNPFNSEMQLVIAGFTDAQFSIGLYNILGQLVDVVHSGSMTGGVICYRAPVWLASGVYIVSASDHRTTESRKVVFLK